MSGVVMEAAIKIGDQFRKAYETLNVEATECKKLLKSRQSLKEHIRTLHKGVQFPCGQCENVFKSRRLSKSMI